MSDSTIAAANASVKLDAAFLVAAKTFASAKLTLATASAAVLLRVERADNRCKEASAALDATNARQESIMLRMVTSETADALDAAFENDPIPMDKRDKMYYFASSLRRLCEAINTAPFVEEFAAVSRLLLDDSSRLDDAILEADAISDD